MKLSNLIFLFTIAILPFSFAINPVSGIDLNVIRIIIPILFLIWLSESLLHKKLFIDTRPRFLFFILFLILVFLSVFWAPEQIRAWRKILFIFSFVPIYFITFDLFKKSAALKDSFLKILLITSTIQSILGIFQFLLQFIIGINNSLNVWKITSRIFLGGNFAQSVHEHSSWLVNLNGETVLRTFGTFPDPHLFSLFISLSIPLSWYFFQKTRKSHYLIIILFQLTAVMLSFSRSSYLAIIIFLTLFGITELTKKMNQKKNTWIYLSGALLLLFIFLIPNAISNRLHSSFNLKEGSNQGRIEMWEKSVNIIREKPLSGVGIGNFSYTIKPSSNFREPIYAHNLFLDFGSETGLPSLILLLLFFISVFSHISFQKENLLNKTIIYIFLIFFVFSLFETPFYSIRIFPLFLIFLAIPHEKK